MKHISTLALYGLLLALASSQVTNPFTNTFRGGSTSNTFARQGGSLPNFTSTFQQAPVVQQAVIPQITTTQVTQVQTPAPAPVPVVQAPPAHTHVQPAPVMPSVGPAFAHAHGPQVAVAPQPVPGFPHAHSGHPYIAPAVAPQRMTYQQIIEYLTNTNGINLATMLRNGSGNFLTQCKAYCDTLPPSPVCDSSNVLYRNECEAKCVHKTTSTTNLRYGMCCCSDDDFDYDDSSNVYYSNVDTFNFCVSTCIYNCLGQQTPIEAEHDDLTPTFELSFSTTGCKSIN